MTADAIKKLDKRIEAIGWSLWLIWIGVIGIIPGLPDGTGMLGTALLLLALNVARYRRHIPVSDFSLILGVLALIDGGVDLLRDQFAFRLELEFFPVLLVIIGTIMVVRAAGRLRHFDGADQTGDVFEKPKRGTGETESALNALLDDGARTEMMQRT